MNASFKNELGITVPLRVFIFKNEEVICHFGVCEKDKLVTGDLANNTDPNDLVIHTTIHDIFKNDTATTLNKTYPLYISKLKQTIQFDVTGSYHLGVFRFSYNMIYLLESQLDITDDSDIDYRIGIILHDATKTEKTMSLLRKSYFIFDNDYDVASWDTELSQYNQLNMAQRLTSTFIQIFISIPCLSLLLRF